jgi:RNA polymerase sigma-70 factor (ECF subfamily)
VPERFEAIYQRHFDSIFRYVLHRVADVAEAEDLTSQTFFKALRGIDRYRPGANGSAEAWLYRIATNEVSSHFRRRRTRHAVATVPCDDELLEERAGAETIVARHRLFSAVHRAMRTLPQLEQALITLRYFEQKPFGKIAEILNKRPGSLTMRTHRALSKLRAELEREGIDHEELREVLDRPVEAGC